MASRKGEGRPEKAGAEELIMEDELLVILQMVREFVFNISYAKKGWSPLMYHRYMDSFLAGSS